MSTTGSTHRDALMRMGAATAEAVARVLETFVPGAIQRGEVTVYGEGESPLNSVARGSVAASVSYVEGVTGANIFLLPPAGARALAVAMGAPDVDQGAGGEALTLSDLEVSAIAEASNQMMAAAAAAIGVLLGQQIEISPPDTRVIDDPAVAREALGTAPHATSTTFMIGGESCRLIQLVPSAFVVRMARALDQLGTEAPGVDGHGDGTGHTVGSSVALLDALGDIKLRVWAELGRTELPLGDALGLPLGAVVELDQAADAPVDLFVNGMRFARGRLIVTDDAEWAFALDEVSGHRTPAAQPSPIPAPPQPDPQREGAVS
jgi:flagellar motor switch protein FliN/FliY